MSSATELSLYIHVPFCRRRCAYCSFVSYAQREGDIPVYVNALISEMQLRRVEGAVVKTIYFGGGTPSLLPPHLLEHIIHTLDEYFLIDDHAEITLEANPGTIDLNYLKAMRGLGFNRLSLGVQSLDDAELQLLGRIHTADEARQSITQCQAAGFQNLSLDFIYGVPGRTHEQWRAMLDEIATLGAQHLSLYGLTLEEDTPLHAMVGRGETAAPDNDAEASEYEMAEDMLAKAGYGQYEISNWALPGLESRHNTAYWQRTPYLGLGVAAHSFMGDKRIANTSNLDEYLACLAQGQLPPQTIEVIDEATALSEAIILGLRLNRGVAADDIRRRFGIDLYRRFESQIAECEEYGLLERQGDIMRLTPRGRLLGNQVFLRFLA